MAGSFNPELVATPKDTVRLNICHEGGDQVIFQSDDLIHIRLKPGTVLEFFNNAGECIYRTQAADDASKMWE